MFFVLDPEITTIPGVEPNAIDIIDGCQKRVDCDPNSPPFDDLRNYAFEGGGSIAGSLSSLASGMIKCYFFFFVLYKMTDN